MPAAKPPKVKTNLWRRRRPAEIFKKRNKVEDGFLLNVFTWNVEGKGTPEEIDKILSKNERPHKVICLQEANFPASGETKNYKWLCSGGNGSAVLVEKESDLTNCTFNQCCKQICVADMTGKNNITIKVISCYIPPAVDYQCDELWNKLKELIKSIPPNIAYVIAGDLNAQLGFADPRIVKSTDLIVGTVLYHSDSNENGVKLEELGRKAHLRIASTLGPEAKKADCYTFKDGEIKSQQDFIILSNMRQGYSSETQSVWHPGYNHSLLSTRFIFTSMEKYAYGMLHDQLDKPKLVVSSWNIQGATPAQVDSMLAAFNLPIISVQDLFLTSDEDIKTEHYCWYTSKKHWAKNVGILVQISSSIVVSNFEAISECLCIADITFHEKSFKVISCYLPLSSDPRYETTVTQLTELVKKIPEGTFFVIAGDFNTSSAQFSGKDYKETNKNDNEKVLEKLAEDEKLLIKTVAWKHRVMVNLPSKITETEKSNPHHILMPLESDLWKQGTAKNTNYTKLFFRWIPFFENAIVNLYMSDAHIGGNLLKGENVELFVVPATAAQATGTSPVYNTTEEIKDGVIYLSRVLEYEADLDDEETPEKEPQLSPEDLEKFKNTPPSPEDLKRLLKDFVIFYGPNIRSSIVNTQFKVLVNSFKAGNFGRFSIDEIKASSEATKEIISWTCRIKWKGIVLAEYVEKGDNLKTFQQARKKAINSLIANLSQVFYTVRGKLSFYHKGLPPILMNEGKLDKVISIVDKKSVPTKEDMLKHIDNFFSKDTESDLVFGKDFTDEDFKSIMFHAKSNKLGYRFYSSTSEQDRLDHMALFKKQSPQNLRDKLIKKPDDFKFYAIPPCGLGEDFVKFNLKYEGQNLKDEARLMSMASRKAHDAAKPKTEVKRVTSTPRTQIKPTVRNPIRKPTVPVRRGPRDPQNWFEREQQRSNNHPQTKEQQQRQNNQFQRGGNARRAPVAARREERPSRNWYESEQEDERNQRLLLEQRKSLLLRIDEERQRNQRLMQERQREPPARQVSRKRPFDYEEVWEKPTPPVWQSQEIDDRQWGNNDVQVWQSQSTTDDRQWSIDDHIWHVQNSESKQWRDTADQTNQWRNTADQTNQWRNTADQTNQWRNTADQTNQWRNAADQTNQWRNTADQTNQWRNTADQTNQWRDTADQNRPYRDLGTSQWKENNQTRQYFDTEMPTPKRPRLMDLKILPSLSLPQWRDLAPLVVVWPITVRSQLEDRPRQVLEANFPTEFVQGNNAVAVVVTLPMSNRTEKKFCLSVEDSQNNAARSALQQIVNHSTVIKPSPNYLCDGLAPNFVRYKVPCQTSPRIYIILSKQDTGYLTRESIREIFETFLASFNEDLFFDKAFYTLEEKNLLLNEAPKFDLKVRHFGDEPKLADRYICVYKTKPKFELLEEVLKMRGFHPKYTLGTDKLPPRLGLNVF